MKMDIGTHLKQLRKDKELKQNEVAAKIGLNVTSYNKIENNNRSLTVDELRVVSNLFEVDPKTILGEDREDPIINYMKKNKDLSPEAKTELNNVLIMIDDAYGQFELSRGDIV